MVKALEAAIPGQSLTDEPRNYPWERPPEVVDPNEAIMLHLERLSQPRILDNVLFAIEYGTPTKMLAELICTGAVAKGIHSVDVSLIIAPVLQEYLNATARQAGIEYIEEFSTEEEDSQLAKRKAVALVAKSIKANKDKDEGSEFLMEISQEQEATAPEDETVDEQENMQMEMDLEEPAESKPRGLMARG